MKMKDEVFPSQVLLEISRGYSIFTVNNKNYYFKHFSIEEMLELEEFEKNQMIVAQKSGIKTRTELLKFLTFNDILAVFHYVPLHSAKAGLNFGEFSGTDEFTTSESGRLIRLPMYYGLEKAEVSYVTNTIKKSYDQTK